MAIKKKSRKLNKKKSRKLNKKKSRRGTRLKRVMRGGVEPLSYGFMKKYIPGVVIGSWVKRHIILDTGEQQIIWKNEMSKDGSLDISNLIELEKNDTTLNIKSEAGHLNLKVVKDDTYYKNPLHWLYMKLLILKLKQKKEKQPLEEDDIAEVSRSIPIKNGDIGFDEYIIGNIKSELNEITNPLESTNM